MAERTCVVCGRTFTPHAASARMRPPERQESPLLPDPLSTGLAPAHGLLAGAMAESELLADVEDACAKLGLDLFHVRDARRQHLEDMPDCLIVGDRRIWLYELKRQGGRPTPGQRRILDRLGAAGTYRAGLWKPAEWLDGSILRTLLEGKHAGDNDG